MRQHINLIDKGILSQEQTFSLKAMAIPLLMVVGVLAVIGGTLFELRSSQVLEKELQSLTINHQQLQNEIAILNNEISAHEGSAQDQIPVIQQRLKQVQDLLHSRILWSEVLRHISLLVPKGIYLTRLEATEDGIPGPFSNSDARGLRFVGSARSHDQITFFIAALEQSRRFTDVSLVYAERNSDLNRPGVGFELVGHLDEGYSRL